MSPTDRPDWSSVVSLPRQGVTTATVVANGQSFVNVSTDPGWYGIAIGISPSSGNTVNGGFIVQGMQTGIFYTSQSGKAPGDGWFPIPGFAISDTTLQLTLFAADTNTAFYIDGLFSPLNTWTQQQADVFSPDTVNLTQVDSIGFTLGQQVKAKALPVVTASDYTPQGVRRSFNLSIAAGANATIVTFSAQVWYIMATFESGAPLSLQDSTGADIFWLAAAASNAPNNLDLRGSAWGGNGNVNIHNYGAGTALTRGSIFA